LPYDQDSNCHDHKLSPNLSKTVTYSTTPYEKSIPGDAYGEAHDAAVAQSLGEAGAREAGTAAAFDLGVGAPQGEVRVLAATVIDARVEVAVAAEAQEARAVATEARERAEAVAEVGEEVGEEAEAEARAEVAEARHVQAAPREMARIAPAPPAPVAPVAPVAPLLNVERQMAGDAALAAQAQAQWQVINIT
jgi:hypothetical protein